MKHILACLLVCMVAFGCVTYKVQTGYLVRTNGEKIEFKDARIGWDNEGHFFEVQSAYVNFSIPKNEVAELYFKGDISK